MRALVLVVMLFSLVGCNGPRREVECSKVAKVLRCLEETCRVEFENGERDTTRVASIGDVYCRDVRFYDDGRVRKDYWFNRELRR